MAADVFAEASSNPGVVVMDSEDRNAVMLAGLLQVLFIVAGFIALATVMKLNGYPQEIFIRWKPLALWLRQYGPYLLLVPLFWIILTFVCCLLNRESHTAEFAAPMGFFLAAVLLILFLAAAVDSYKRPLLTFVDPLARSNVR
jgi:hypothetical protein